jgi:hypothetical protein
MKSTAHLQKFKKSKKIRERKKQQKKKKTFFHKKLWILKQEKNEMNYTRHSIEEIYIH